MNLAPTPFYWAYRRNLVINLAMHEAFLPNSGMLRKLMCAHMCARVFPEKRFLFSQVEGGTEFVTVKNLVFICRSEFASLPTVDKVL